MFELSKTFYFEAGHSLEGHDGTCGRPHGHSYSLIVTLKSDTLIDSGPKKNMVIDFQDITDIVKPMLRKYFDHHWLNDSLGTTNPSVEFIARWIYHHLKPLLPNLDAITIEETRTAKVTYREN